MKFKLMKQRIKRGYHDEDVWALNSYFLEVFIPALKQLKETKHGVPMRYCIDRDVDEGDELWQKDMDEMIGHFEQIDLNTTDKEVSKQNEYHIKEGFKMFAEQFEELWD